MRNIHFFLICFFLIGINFTDAETLKIASIDWCPQLCPDQKKQGYVMDTVEMIFNAGPYDIEIRTYPWSRAIFLVRKGKAHALLAPAKIYMAFSPEKSQKDQVRKMMIFFDERMEILKRSQQIQHIMNRYGLKEW